MVNIYKIRFTVLQQEILRFLFMNAGKKLNARGLAKSLDVSQPAISKALPLLEKRSLILVSKDKESKRLEIELNRDSPFVIGLKRADNIRLLYESGLAEFMMEKFAGCTVIVFGSFAKGEDNFKSDIDMAVIGTKGKSIALDAFEKKLMKEIRINYYNSFKDINGKLRNNILGGIFLSGWIDLC